MGAMKSDQELQIEIIVDVFTAASESLLKNIDHDIISEVLKHDQGDKRRRFSENIPILGNQEQERQSTAESDRTGAALSAEIRFRA
jgi:hypothetical protein